MNTGSVEPVTVEAPRAVSRPLLRQRWRDVALVHWRIDPAAVAALLPRGCVPDVLDGETFVGLVPFRMCRTAVGPLPPIPYLGDFPETNVRLYCVDSHGRRGVVFRSLDAARLLPVLFGRWVFGLPYAWSSMRLARHGDTIEYRCRRRWPRRLDRAREPRGSTTTGPNRRRSQSAAAAPRAGTVVRIALGAPISRPSPLEHFLTARWGLCERHAGRTRYLPNAHEPWPLRRARLLECDTTPLTAAGLPVGDAEPVSVLYSPGVTARFGAPLPIGD